MDDNMDGNILAGTVSQDHSENQNDTQPSNATAVTAATPYYGRWAVEPAWFQPAIQSIHEAFQPIHDTLNRMGNSLSAISRTTALKHNRSQCEEPGVDLDTLYFDVVRFLNGDDPTVTPHNLPPLYTIRNIHELSLDDTELYCRGYSAEDAHLPLYDERIPFLLKAIGAERPGDD